MSFDSREGEELLVLQRGGQCDRSARVAREFKELEFRISNLDKPVSISYFWKRTLAKLYRNGNSSDEQNSSLYQLDTRIGNARLPNESRNGGPRHYTREGQPNQTGLDDRTGSC